MSEIELFLWLRFHLLNLYKCECILYIISFYFQALLQLRILSICPILLLFIIWTLIMFNIFKYTNDKDNHPHTVLVTKECCSTSR